MGHDWIRRVGFPSSWECSKCKRRTVRNYPETKPRASSDGSCNTERGFILQGIRNYLGFNSSATIDELVSHFNANQELTRAVIDDLIANGGLRWNDRARLYQPQPV